MTTNGLCGVQDGREPLRFAVVTSGTSIEAWQRNALRLLPMELARPVLVIRIRSQRARGATRSTVAVVNQRYLHREASPSPRPRTCFAPAPPNARRLVQPRCDGRC